MSAQHRLIIVSYRKRIPPWRTRYMVRCNRVNPEHHCTFLRIGGFKSHHEAMTFLTKCLGVYRGSQQ